MLKLLCIGNSFSDDATRYLAGVARADRQEIRVFNLMIPGCPLSTHFRMMRSGEAGYYFRFNGQDTGLKMALDRALGADEWDVVTLQQVSHLAPRYETYRPYLNELATHVRSFVPKARVMLHQTWAYEEGGVRLTQELGYAHQADMFRDVQSAYAQAAADIHADGVLPSGEMFQRLIRQGLSPVHRDGFHAELGKGRYALGALWYDLLTGRTVEGNAFRDLDVPMPEEQFPVIQRLAHELADEYRG